MENFKIKNQRNRSFFPRIKVWSPFLRITSWILILSFLNLSTGCMTYFKVREVPEANRLTLQTFYLQDKKMVIHYEGKAWIMEVPEVKGDTLTAIARKIYTSTLATPVKKDKPNRFIIKEPYNQYDILSEVHIYTTELTRNLDDVIRIPLSAINDIEIYEYDKTATNVSSAFGGLGTAILMLGGFFAILAMASCPFIYVPGDEDYELVGEIYSGSVQPALERHDYLKLPNRTFENKPYQLKISNELKEKQHTNLLELWVFDHNADTEIVVDKYGDPQSLKNTVSPILATNLEGQEILDKVSTIDEKFYTSSKYEGELALTDGVFAQFHTPEKPKNAKVKIRAKNNILLDFMLGEFYDEIGDLYKPWDRLQKRTPEEKQRNWMLNQNIPLKLSVERNGNWEYIDYYHIVGPVAMKEDVLSFALDGTESEPLKIKLEFGNFFWDIDYVGVDFSDSEFLEPQIVSIETALDQDHKSVKKKLNSDDNKYYSQNIAGTYATVDFLLPEKTMEQRTIYLHTKGWYEILRNPSGTPDREYLETFRQPGRFNQFVNDFVQRLASKN